MKNISVPSSKTTLIESSLSLKIFPILHGLGITNANFLYSITLPSCRLIINPSGFRLPPHSVTTDSTFYRMTTFFHGLYHQVISISKFYSFKTRWKKNRFAWIINFTSNKHQQRFWLPFNYFIVYESHWSILTLNTNIFFIKYNYKLWWIWTLGPISFWFSSLSL